MYGPDGTRLFDTILQGPENGRIQFAAGPGGGILFLDPTGKQTRISPSGRSAGSATSRAIKEKTAKTTSSPGAIHRRYSMEGKVLGSFLRRSQFPKKLSPFATSLGGWRVRAAERSIGALAYASSQPEWIELDLDGNLMGRWPLGKPLNGGIAYTADGRVFRKTWDQQSKQPRLLVLDRATRDWGVVNDGTVHAGGKKSVLLGADYNDLFFADQGGIRLVWVRPVAP